MKISILLQNLFVTLFKGVKWFVIIYYRLFICIIFASCVNFCLAQTIFSSSILNYVYEINNLFKLNDNLTVLNLIDNPSKLKKMKMLWSPPTHPFLYFAHSTAVIALIKVIQEQRGSTSDKFERIIVISISTIIFNLLPYRIGEMHIIVIFLNFVHVFTINAIAEFILHLNSCIKN